MVRGFAAAVVLSLSACPDRPVETDTDSTADPSTSSSGEATTGPPTTTSSTSATEPTTSAPATTTGESDTMTSAPVTTGETDTTGVETTGGPSRCGPPCARTWELDGDLEIMTAGEDLSQFACLTRVHGDVRIPGSYSAEALAVFANLEVVDEWLSLTENDVLGDLAPFSCLRSLGALDLWSTPALTDLSALAGLSQVRWISLEKTGVVALPDFAADFSTLESLRLVDNPALSDLAAASAWSSGGLHFGLTIRGCPAITSLEPLAGLLGTSDEFLSVELDDLVGLPSLKGLETATGGLMVLHDLPLVADLTPLSAFGSIGLGNLDLGGMPLVTSLAGVGASGSLRTLSLGGSCESPEPGPAMDGLTSLAGLGATHLERLKLANNANLVSLTGADGLQQVDQLSVADNPKLSQAAIDAFIAEVGPVKELCVGDWDSCTCPVMP